MTRNVPWIADSIAWIRTECFKIINLDPSVFLISAEGNKKKVWSCCLSIRMWALFGCIKNI